MLFLLSASMIDRRLQDSNLDSRHMFEFLSLCACRRNQILVKGSVSALRWSGNQCLLQWNTVHSGNDGEHNVNVHPLEGDQAPYQDCSRCVCCIRAGLGVKLYFQILGSQPVKSTLAVKVLLEYVVFFLLTCMLIIYKMQ